VVVTSVRLPKSLGEALTVLLLEIQVGAETTVCQRCRLTPHLPLLQELLQELLVGRRLHEFPEAANDFSDRYRGPMQKAVSAAIRLLPVRFEQAEGD